MLNWNCVPNMGEIIYAENRNGDKTRFVVLPSYGFNPERPSYILCEIVDFGYDLKVMSHGNTVKDAIDCAHIMFSYTLTLCREHQKGNVIYHNTISLFNSPIILNERLETK